MAPRAYWRGHVRLALVTFPVRLYTAVTSTNTISLNMIHEPTGRRIHYQTMAEDVGPVDRSEIVKGSEVGKGRYVTLEDEELDALRRRLVGGSAEDPWADMADVRQSLTTKARKSVGLT